MSTNNKIIINVQEIELLETINNDDSFSFKFNKQNTNNKQPLRQPSKQKSNIKQSPLKHKQLTSEDGIEQKACVRLYNHAIALQYKKRAAAKEQLKTEASKYSFKPELNETSIQILNKSYEYQPIYQRYQEVINKSKEKITKMKKSLNVPLSHIPSINKPKLKHKEPNNSNIRMYKSNSIKNIKLNNIKNNDNKLKNNSSKINTNYNLFHQNIPSKNEYNINDTENFLKKQAEILQRSYQCNKTNKKNNNKEKKNFIFQTNTSSTCTSDLSKNKKYNEILKEKVCKLNKLQIHSDTKYKYYLPNDTNDKIIYNSNNYLNKSQYKNDMYENMNKYTDKGRDYSLSPEIYQFNFEVNEHHIKDFSKTKTKMKEDNKKKDNYVYNKNNNSTINVKGRNKIQNGNNMFPRNLTKYSYTEQYNKKVML